MFACSSAACGESVLGLQKAATFPVAKRANKRLAWSKARIENLKRIIIRCRHRKQWTAENTIENQDIYSEFDKLTSIKSVQRTSLKTRWSVVNK